MPQVRRADEADSGKGAKEVANFAQTAASEALAGLVERVTFHNPENGFCVLRVKARGHRDLVTVVGGSVSDRAIEVGRVKRHYR